MERQEVPDREVALPVGGMACVVSADGTADDTESSTVRQRYALERLIDWHLGATRHHERAGRLGRGLSQQQKDCLRLAYALHRHNGGNDVPRFARYEQPEHFRSACGFFDTQDNSDDFSRWHSLRAIREWDIDAARFYVCGKPLAVRRADILSHSQDVAIRRAAMRLHDRGLLVHAYMPRCNTWGHVGAFLTAEGIRVARELPPMDIPDIALVLAWSAQSRIGREASLRRGQVNGCPLPAAGKDATDTDNGCKDDIAASATVTVDKASGARAQLIGRDVSGAPKLRAPEDRAPTLKQIGGSR